MSKPSGIRWTEPYDLVSLFEAGADRTIPGFETAPGGVLRLNLGAGVKKIAHTVALDLPEWDSDRNDLPYSDNTVSAIYAFHLLEHVSNPVRLLRECQRVLKPGGVLNVVVPYYKSEGAFHDLDHKHFFSESTWSNLFDNQFYDKNHDGWLFKIGLNLIMGLNERNLMLVTQLIKETD